MNESSRTRTLQLAREALVAALSRDLLKAGNCIQYIHDDHGVPGIWLALMYWCDAYALYATDGDPGVSNPAPIRVFDVNTGAMADPRHDHQDEIPRQVKWATALIEARCAMDQGRFTGLMHELPRGEPAVCGQYVAQVLDCVALTINGLPRGFARMGQGR